MIDKKKLVSIILPIYNGEKFISACVDSIINQSYSNWELLIIDDGSTDNTAVICDSYQKDESRISVIHKNNNGVSAARNDGLILSKGEYIVFVDADDIMTPDSLLVRVNLISNADFAVAGYNIIDAAVQDVCKMPCFSEEQWNREETVRNICLGRNAYYQGYLWNKIFLKRIIDEHHISFTNGISYNEDRLFCATYSLYCNRVNLSNHVVYLYRITSDSAMGSLVSCDSLDKHMSEFTAYDNMLNLLREFSIECYYLLIVEAQDKAMYRVKQIDKSKKELRRAYKMLILKYGLKVLSAPINIVSIKKKIIILGHALLRR